MAGFLRLTFGAALVALPLWLSLTTPAQACSLAPFTYAEVSAQADLIVIGTVHDIRIVSLPATPRPGDPLSPGSQHGDVEWTVDVEEYVKGSGPMQLLFTSRTDIYLAENGEPRFSPGLSASCGWAPQEGSYLLFAASDEGRYVAHFPSLRLTSENEQRALDVLAEVRAALRDGALLPTTGSGPPSHSVSIMVLAGMSALAAAAVATSAFLGFRRSRDR